MCTVPLGSCLHYAGLWILLYWEKWPTSLTEKQFSSIPFAKKLRGHLYIWKRNGSMKSKFHTEGSCKIQLDSRRGIFKSRRLTLWNIWYNMSHSEVPLYLLISVYNRVCWHLSISGKPYGDIKLLFLFRWDLKSCFQAKWPGQKSTILVQLVPRSLYAQIIFIIGSTITMSVPALKW